MWCSALVALAVVVWSWVVNCVHCALSQCIVNFHCALCTFTVHCELSQCIVLFHNAVHSSTQPQPAQPMQNTICGSAHTYSPVDGLNDARNILRQKFDNKYEISCILLVSLSSPYVHDARSQQPKISLTAMSFCARLLR